ncbi:MAG: aspartate aminotransferase family protein [Actinobacteria bacterium]|nr:aspartate aminotransferase family protein [Actinomycetota bacterium]
MQDHTSDLILDAARRAASYLSVGADEPASPSPDALVALGGFATELSERGEDPAKVLARLDELGSPATMRSTAGRYFGFVNGGTEPAGLAASILTAAWDQNAALPVMSPVAAHLDDIAARWVLDLLDLPESAVATFCGGASVANITCVLTARDALLHRVGWSVDRQGLAGSPPIKVVLGAEAHVSATKALRVAGIGQDQVTVVPTDSCGRMIAAEVPSLDSLTLLLLQAGNVNTGHSDPFAEIIPAANTAGAWTHIDGAFGLWTAVDPALAHLVAGADLADSWATDAHKWLNSPYDSGLAIVAKGEDLRRAMAVDAAYVSTTSDRALMHLGLQMSQRARGVETWAVLASLGRAGVADIIERTCRLCRQLAQALDAGGAHILAPVVVNQALVSFGDDDMTDAVIAAVQADGTVWAGGTRWQGRSSMRLSVSSTTSTERDMEVAAETILRCWRSVA